MPLGNLTSQFFANVYLNELDQFVKHKLKAKYYIRYVDDFVVLHSNKQILKDYKFQINEFLKEHLKIELHPDKSNIILLNQRLNLLGFRVFYHYKLLRKSNLRRISVKLRTLREQYLQNKVDYDFIYNLFEGWLNYAKQADTYKLRKDVLEYIENNFSNEISEKEISKLNKLI